VIAIVGILSGFVLVSLNSATDSANDARRKSDLSQIVKALLVYNTSNPTYPIETCSIGSTCSATVNNALGQASGITGPNNTYYTYSSIDGTSFTVSAIMSDTDIYSYDSETGYSESPAEPGLPGYAKRQPITINSASALTDYQVKLTITYDSDMQPDFDDLRFTSADGTTELSYWLESKTDSTTAIVWVKVPSLASGDNTLYMYYANASATTASNGDNTFELFDDFLGTSLDTTKWYVVYGSPSVINSTLVVASAEVFSGFLPANDMILEARLKTSTYGGSSDAMEFGYTVNVWTYCARMFFCGSEYRQKYVHRTTGGYTAYNIPSWSANEWHLVRFKAGPTSGKWSVDRSEAETTITTGYAHPMTSDRIIFRAYPAAYTLTADWVFIRKYATTEPTPSFGVEQNN